MKEKEKKEIFWYDNPNTITSIIIGLIAVIIILSQSFAVNNNLSTVEILKNIINHNSIYFISLVYFIALKTYIGKKYFNFLNLFLIIFYFVTSITSLLTVFQTFSLSTLISLALHVVIFIYLTHVFLKKTKIWKDFKLEKSPFNEIKNDAYFYITVVLEVALLSLNLIFSNSIDGTILALLDAFYIIMFARYVYLYGYYLDMKYNKKDFNTTFDEVKEKLDEVKEQITEKVENTKEKLDENLAKKNAKTSKKGDK